MKTKIISSLFAIVLSCLLLGFARQQTACVLVLTNVKTNKSIKFCDKNSVQKVEAVLGAAISLDKEMPDDKEEPIFTFTYDGLIIEMQNDLLRNLTITNKKWKLNTFTIGTPIEQIASKYEKNELNYFKNIRFKLKDSKGLLFAEVDDTNKVKKLGVAF